MTMLNSFKNPIQSSYGPWNKTSCYRGIDYCVKRASYNDVAKKYEWWVKFRNNYQTTVSFSFIAKESNVRSAETSSRLTVRSGEDGSNWFLLADANSIRVFVDRLRFGDDNGGKYAPCDN